MTIRRVTWGIHAARHIAAARGLDPIDGEAFARSLAGRIADIAQQIAWTEKRRGPREIALYQLRQVAGRHAAAIPDLVMSADIADAAAWLLHWAEQGPRLAAENSKLKRTPPRAMRVSVFHNDGRLTRWERVVEFAGDDGDPARHDGRG